MEEMVGIFRCLFCTIQSVCPPPIGFIKHAPVSYDMEESYVIQCRNPVSPARSDMDESYVLCCCELRCVTCLACSSKAIVPYMRWMLLRQVLVILQTFQSKLVSRLLPRYSHSGSQTLHVL